MTKPIRSYPEGERAKVIARRLKEKKGGLGYLSAVDAVQKGKVKVEEKEKEEVETS